MTTPAFAPGHRGFLRFAKTIGADIAPHQRAISRAHHGPQPECVIVIPKGNWKTSTAGLIGLHHLLSVPAARVYAGAASRDQVEQLWSEARDYAEQGGLGKLVIPRIRELRGPGGSHFRVLASDGPKAHHLAGSLYLLDELWAHRDDGLLRAFQAALIKRRGSKLLILTTAAPSLDSPLGKLRGRCLAQPDVRRDGALTDARGPAIRMLEWSVAEDRSLDDLRAVKQANPAPTITIDDLRLARERLPDPEFATFAACRWGISDAAWLPVGAWAACRGPVDLTPREVILGADIGGSRAASALVGVTPDLQVPICRVFQGDDSVLAVTDAIVELQAAGWTIREVAYDPWRYQSESLRLERDHGLRMVEFPQSHARMVPASERLHAVIVEGKLRHPGFPDLDRHVAGAIARRTGRGWRLDKSARAALIDSVVALAMAVERAQEPRATRAPHRLDLGQQEARDPQQRIADQHDHEQPRD